MFKLPFLLLSKMGGIALAVGIAWLGWQHLGPVKPEAGAQRLDLLKEAIPQIVEDIRGARGDIRSAALLHFEHDPSDKFTDTLRDAIEKQGILDLRDRTVVEKAFNLLNLRHPAFPQPEEAREKGRGLRVAAVIHGSVNSWETAPEGTVLDVGLFFTDVENGNLLLNKRYERQSDNLIASNTARVLTDPVKRRPLLQRLFAWILLVLLLPVFTISFLRAMVRKGSNSKNAFVLSIYTVADALLAWLLVSASLNAWMPALMFIGAVAMAFLYNVRIMTFALRLEEE